MLYGLNAFELTRLFSTGEIAAMAVILVLAVLLIIGNFVVAYLIKKHRERKLCTEQLQRRREELLRELEAMKAGGLISANEEEEEAVEETEEFFEEGDDDIDDDEEMGYITAEDEDFSEAIAGDAETSEFDRRLRIMKASAMTPSMREKFSLVGEEFDDKSYYVRMNYSFEAKVLRASEDVQQRYLAILNEIALYQGLKVSGSSKQQRIYKGRKTLGLIMFRGRTLCLALALDPQEYAETKYRGIDMSEKKRFAATPMLFKLTSARKLEYAKYLLVQLADANTIVMNENPEPVEMSFDAMTDGELFDADKLKIFVLGEVPQDVLDRLEEEKKAKDEEEAKIAAEAAAAETAAPAEKKRKPKDTK